LSGRLPLLLPGAHRALREGQAEGFSFFTQSSYFLFGIFISTDYTVEVTGKILVADMVGVRFNSNETRPYGCKKELYCREYKLEKFFNISLRAL
jgi:hypothetical protein